MRHDGAVWCDRPVLRNLWVQTAIVAAAVVGFGLLTHQDPGYYVVLAVVVSLSTLRARSSQRSVSGSRGSPGV